MSRINILLEHNKQTGDIVPKEAYRNVHLANIRRDEINKHLNLDRREFNVVSLEIMDD